MREKGRIEFYSEMHKIPISVSLILYAHSLFCSSPRDINFRINVIHLKPQTVRGMQGPLCDERLMKRSSMINADEHFDDFNISSLFILHDCRSNIVWLLCGVSDSRCGWQLVSLSVGRSLCSRLKYLCNHLMDCHENWCRYLQYPEDES